MNKVIKNNEKYIENYMMTQLTEEKRWATHLFSKGSMVGLSEKLLHNYVEWTANKRMKAIGLKQSMNKVNQSITWTEHWFNSRSLQNAPQETEIESYVIGGIKQDVEKGSLRNLNFNNE